MVTFRGLWPGEAEVTRVADGVLDPAVVPERARVLAIAVQGGGEVVGAALSVVHLRADKAPETNEVGVAGGRRRRRSGQGPMQLALDEALRRGRAEARVASDPGETALAFCRTLGGLEQAGHTHFTGPTAGGH